MKYQLVLKVLFIATLVGMLAILSGCSDDDSTTPTESIPPEIPPQSAFIMDFDNFESDGTLTFSSGNVLGTDSYINWGQSAFRVAFWQLALTVTLAVPVAAYVEAFNHDAVQQEDNSWEWTYDVTVDSTTYTCRLVGQTDESTTHWEMYVTRQGDYEDYLWYSGNHNLPLTEGNWTVNREPDQSNPFLAIEWTRDPVTQTGDLKYTNIVPEHTNNGNYIYYGSTTDSTYNRFYHLYNSNLANLAEIEWNHEAHYGRVRDEIFYSDSDWHCWDNSLRDVACE